MIEMVMIVKINHLLDWYESQSPLYFLLYWRTTRIYPVGQWCGWKISMAIAQWNNLNNISEKSFRPPAGTVTYSADLQSKNYQFHLKIVEFLWHLSSVLIAFFYGDEYDTLCRIFWKWKCIHSTATKK